MIDANALKYKNLAEVNGRLTYVLTAEEIDNAPTVFTCNACKNMGNERECVDCHDYSNYVHYEERPQDDCENCKHQAKLPSQDPCRRCLHCYISQFEPKGGSEPEMVTNDKLCDECEEKCDWYEKSVKKGNMPIGCSQQIADDEETSD